MLRGGRRDQVGRVLAPQPDRERERGPAAVRLGGEPGQQLLPLRVSRTVGSVFIALRLVQRRASRRGR